MTAEHAAHFTSTLEAKPSLFEIVAQDSLNNILHPAFRKVAVFLTLVNPTKFNWLSEYYDEVFLGLNALLQYYYLRTKDASFSEYFYGLRRIPCDSIKLSDHYRKLSLVFLIVYPYVKRKLEEQIDIYRLENAEGALPKNVNGYCKKLILLSHSFCGIALTGWTLMLYLRYMSDQSDFQTPILQILKLKLIYSAELQDATGFWTAFFRGQLGVGEIARGIFQNSVQSFLEISAFLVQFLQAWNEERPNYNFTLLPVVPPPPKDDTAEKYQGKCPICLQNWKIPTVLPVSGYVFCFPCILKRLRENPACPVTNLPARPLDVVRLYDSSE